MDRREFLKSTLRFASTCVGMSLLSVLVGCKDTPEEPTSDLILPETSAGNVSDLNPGEGKSLMLGTRPALIIRDQDGQFLAYDATCPHMGCTVHYRPEKQDIFCPCHSGTFNLAGQKIFGPPDQPLTPLQVRIQGKVVLVSSVKAGNHER